MAETTGIAWCDSTFNPWIGCAKVSPACDHCYAERDMAHRYKRVEWGAGKERQRTSEANWRKPVQWNKQQFVECMECGWRGELRDGWKIVAPAGFNPPLPSAKVCPQCKSPTLLAARRRVFCASLSDVFDNEVPDAWRMDLMTLIANTPSLDWLLLTKRIGNVRGRTLPDNVWLGITVCNQDEAARDIPKLLATPAAVRFLSIEPMLSDIRLGSWLELSPSAAFVDGRVTREMPAWTRIGSTAIDWVIVGGESGPHARPMTLGWAKDVVRQCQAAGVPVFVKQLGARPVNHEGEPHPITDRAGGIVDEWPPELRVRQHPKDQQLPEAGDEQRGSARVSGVLSESRRTASA